MSRIDKEEKPKEKPRSGFERNKNNWPLIIAVIGWFVLAIVYTIKN
jgi:hypothetical protein